MTSKQLLFNRPVPQGWQMLTVDEIKANEPRSCVAGPFGSSISSKYFVPEGVPVIRGNNLSDNLKPFVPHGFVFVSEEKAESFKAQQVKGGDLVFTCWGTLGQVALIPKNGPYSTYIISNKQLKLRPNLEICDARFLFYYFASPQMVQHIRSIAIGAAVPGINLGILKSLQVVIPPLPTQRKIAGILSAYDRLIENNTRRIEILEEMARSLYREWFVKFRFPGHEQVQMVDSELGLIPEGWEVKPIGDVAEVGRGSSPRPIADQKYFEGGTIPWIKIADATKSGKYLYETKQKVNEYGASFSRLLPKGSLIIAASGTLGYTQLLGVDGCIHDGWLYLINFNGIEKEYLYYLFLEQQQFFYNAAYGAAIQNVNTMILREMKIILPPSQIQKYFKDIISKSDNLLDNLGRKNLNLRQTRDLLLPRLISGEIDVENLDINTGLIAA